MSISRSLFRSCIVQARIVSNASTLTSNRAFGRRWKIEMFEIRHKQMNRDGPLTVLVACVAKRFCPRYFHVIMFFDGLFFRSATFSPFTIFRGQLIDHGRTSHNASPRHRRQSKFSVFAVSAHRQTHTVLLRA